MTRKISRKESLINNQGNGRLLSGNISLTKSPKNKIIGKDRSSTFRENLNELKLKNEQVVRNDYFEEMQQADNQ